jgi:hypothetical protein
MSNIYAAVIEDSLFPKGDPVKHRLISIEIYLPKILDAEFEKHRSINSNSSSDRAMSFTRVSCMDPFIPSDIRISNVSMRSDSPAPSAVADSFIQTVMELRDYTIDKLHPFHKMIHKQHLNRYMVAYSMQKKLATATLDWWNYFIKLRAAPDADPAIIKVARCIQQAIQASEPVDPAEKVGHLCYITKEERRTLAYEYPILALASAARCARTSYLRDGVNAPTLEDDLIRANKLIDDIHLTPFDHQATPTTVTQVTNQALSWGDLTELLHDATHIDREGFVWCNSLRGWSQFRTHPLVTRGRDLYGPAKEEA